MNATDEILLVEDDRLDQKAVQRAFQDLKITNHLAIVENGKEALEYLAKPRQTRIAFMLTDINMPLMGGIQLIQELKKDDTLKILPVVVLTTSKEERDLIESYRLGIAGYVMKPLDYKEFVDVVKKIHLYWALSRQPNENPLEKSEL